MNSGYTENISPFFIGFLLASVIDFIKVLPGLIAMFSPGNVYDNLLLCKTIKLTKTIYSSVKLKYSTLNYFRQYIVNFIDV